MFNYKRLLLSVVCSLAATAVVAVAAPSAYAGPTDPKALPAEIIFKALPGMSDAEVGALAAKAGCVVVKPIAYCPGFYLFQLKGYADAHVGKRPAVQEAGDVSPDVTAAISSLKAAMPGVSASPNYVRYHTGFSVPAHSRPAVPLAAQAPKTSQASQKARGRATAPPGTPFTPNDPLYSAQYGYGMMRMPEAWNIQEAIRPVVVGVVDSGIDVGHPDFNTPDGTASRIIGGQNFYPDGPNNSTDLNDIQDRDGHGTHVAGTIAATTNNELGVAGTAGYNRGGTDVRVRIARVFGAIGGSPQDVIYSGVGYLIDSGVDVINMSLGGFGTDELEQTTIQRAISAGIIVVAAAGNENTDNSIIPHYPSDLPGVIKVTAVGRDRTRASYSNYGGPVAVAAPGGDQIDTGDAGIISTWPRNIAQPAGSTQGTGYAAIQGTSMACPHVAGVCALLMAAGAPRNADVVKTALTSTAQPLTDDTPDRKYYGAGLVDAYSALLPFTNPPFTVAFTNPNVDLGATYSGQAVSFNVNVLGVLNKPAPGGARLEIQTATFPSTVVRSFASDTAGGFTVPTLEAGQVKATPFNLNVPQGTAPVTLAPGRYKAVLKVGETEVATRFFEVASRTQPLGRSLFAFPFQIRIANSQSPEQAAFGTGVSFSLARYNPVRLPSDLDYALFQSGANGRRDQAASFNAVAPDGGPLSFDTSNPSVSVAPVGLGYWLNLDTSSTLNTVGNPVTNPVAVRLFASGGGWNMIGAPYLNPTAWATVTVIAGGNTLSLGQAIQQGVISPALVGYRNGDYFFNIFPEGTLEPFNGYWVRVFQDCTLVIPPTGAAVAGASRATLPRPTGWRARLIASVAGDRDGQNYFGQASGAADGPDALDIPKPPSGAGHAYVRFLTPAGSGRSVANAFDMRAADGGSEQQWTAAVSTDRTNADVTVTWDGLGSLPRTGGLTLTDPTTGQTVDMRSRSSFTFRSGEAGSTRELVIRYKRSVSTGALAITGVTVAGGRATGSRGLSVRFNTSREADVVGQVETVTGKVVGALSGATRSAGTGAVTLHWDGRSRAGSPVPAGPYIVVIKARTTDGQAATYRQPFLSNQ